MLNPFCTHVLFSIFVSKLMIFNFLSSLSMILVTFYSLKTIYIAVFVSIIYWQVADSRARFVACEIMIDWLLFVAILIVKVFIFLSLVFAIFLLSKLTIFGHQCFYAIIISQSFHSYQGTIDWFWAVFHTMIGVLYDSLFQTVNADNYPTVIMFLFEI